MHVKKTIPSRKNWRSEAEDHLIGTYYSNLSDAIRDGLRKILVEYKRKNEVEIAATLYKEGKITLREAAVIMDAPMRKTLEELGWEGLCI